MCIRDSHATECEADAISDGKNCFVPAVMEHIELAGVHSGDSACILPSLNLTEKQVTTIKDYTKKIAVEMNVCGLMNMQYAIEDDTVYVLEANPRASRTVPLVSKVCNINMVQLATQIIKMCIRDSVCGDVCFVCHFADRYIKVLSCAFQSAGYVFDIIIHNDLRNACLLYTSRCV